MSPWQQSDFKSQVTRCGGPCWCYPQGHATDSTVG